MERPAKLHVGLSLVWDSSEVSDGTELCLSVKDSLEAMGHVNE